MANEDARCDAAAPLAPADAVNGGAGGIAEWIERARAFNRERDARPSGENSNDASRAEGQPMQAGARSLSVSDSVDTGA
jgi:hypothetical protein